MTEEIKNGQQEPHTHDGEIEFQIPPWLIWSVVGAGVGVVVWLGVDVFLQRRYQRRMMDAAVGVFNEFVAEQVPSVNGQAKADADTSPSEVL